MTSTTSPTITEIEADRALKAKHRALWALGDYDAVATEVIPALGEVTVEAAAVGTGERVLDVAAGSGNASLPAARRGASVVATDLTPELLETGRVRAEQLGVTLEWQTADAEDLPFAAGSFDVAISTVGIMFAPHHQRAADELVRVVRPGGRIALASWTPEGFIGQLFATMKGYVAPPPAGVQPAPLWGSQAHVEELLGSHVDLAFERRTLPITRFTTGAEFRDYFRQNYGPTLTAYRQIADDPTRTASLDADLAALGDGALVDGVMGWEYLLVTGVRR